MDTLLAVLGAAERLSSSGPELVPDFCRHFEQFVGTEGRAAASTRAWQIYLHTTSQRDRVVAEALNPLLAGRSSTTVARHAVEAAARRCR